MPTTDSKEVEIDNTVYLDEFEREILKSGGPIYAEVQTTDGSAVVVFMHSCTWNSDTKDEIEREPYMPGEKVYRLTGTECDIHQQRVVDVYNGARIILDREENA